MKRAIVVVLLLGAGIGLIVHSAWTPSPGGPVTVTIPDGGTAMLGGFRGISEKKFESGMPWLSSIPILNTFFMRRGNLSERRSLVILVTGRIVNLREEERARFSTGE